MSRTKLEFGTSGTIDLMDDVPYSLNFAIADIREPDKRNASYSKTIKIPGSKTNNKLFAHIFEIDINCNFNPNLKTAVRLYVDELLIMQGFLQLLRINRFDENKIEYEVTIRGNVGNIFTEWADSYLTDLDFSAFNHTYHKIFQKATWTAAVGEAYVYPMIDYGVTNGLSYDVNNFYPAIYLKQYIDTAFTFAGYTYESNFFNTDFFKRLIIPYNSTTLLLNATELNSRYFEAERGANYIAKTLTSTAGTAFNAYTTPDPVKIQINTDVSDVSNQFNTTTYEATIGDPGYYQFTANIDFNLTFSGLTVSPSTLPFDFNVYFYIGVFDSNNVLVTTYGGAYYIVPSQTISNGFTTSTYNVTFTTPTVYLIPGQKVITAFSLNSIYLGQAGVIDLNILAGSNFQNKAINEGIVDGDIIDFTAMGIPQNIKIKDLFVSVIRMFNLYIETDKTITNKLYIEPRNDFYANGTTVDWTDKLAVDRELEIEPMGELNASRYDFKYKEDKDYWNSKYSGNFQETYGTKHKDVDTDFIRSTKTVDLIFSPTPLTKIGTTDRIISQIIFPNNTSTTGTQTNQSNLRILYFELKNTANSWTYTGDVSGTGTETQYPYAGHVDVPTLPTVDLCFGVPVEIFYDTTYYTNNNLYNKYYKKYIDEITDKDSKIITGYFYLTPKDIYQLDFRNQFYIDGHLLRLNKIYDYNPLANDLTKCEFIKIKDSLAFTAQSGLSIYGSGITFNTGEPVPAVTTILNKAIIDSGNVIGDDNIVDPGTVKNTIISGNNNYVGAGGTNIAILNSSGVTVMPNIKNVTLINSNDVLVTESNTTYINGVQVLDGQSEQGITATAGGGQTNAYQTSKKFNLIETVATAGDSVKTISATLDQEQQFKNVGANSMNVYPKEGERFRKGTTLLAVDAPYAVASRNSLRVYCYEAGIWTD